jgi:hypothetical protein
MPVQTFTVSKLFVHTFTDLAEFNRIKIVDLISVHIRMLTTCYTLLECNV